MESKRELVVVKLLCVKALLEKAPFLVVLDPWHTGDNNEGGNLSVVALKPQERVERQKETAS